jgi:hypothetical protein
MSVPLKAGASFKPDSAHVLFESDFVANSKQGIAAYDVSPDGQRFYFVQEDSKKDRPAKLSRLEFVGRAEAARPGSQRPIKTRAPLKHHREDVFGCGKFAIKPGTAEM